jgi:hypothetical protein
VRFAECDEPPAGADERERDGGEEVELHPKRGRAAAAMQVLRPGGAEMRRGAGEWGHKPLRSDAGRRLFEF